MVSGLYQNYRSFHHWPYAASSPPVYADGSICLDILQNRWSPTYDVSSILTSIQVCIVSVAYVIMLYILCISRVYYQSLLDEPNPNSPANSQAAQLYQENRREYEKKVLAIVEESWMNV